MRRSVPFYAHPRHATRAHLLTHSALAHTRHTDYRFLEEVKLADDVAKRSRPPAPRYELPPPLQTLIYQAGR